MHQVVGSFQGHLQDRRLCQSGEAMGQAEKPSCYELRQIEQVDKAVLQEGHHEENREVTATGLPVLPPVQLVKCKYSHCKLTLVVFIGCGRGERIRFFYVLNTRLEVIKV